jgi:hypothetical protein
MNRLTLLFYYLLSFASVRAQQPGEDSISGRVIDSLTQKPVEYATVTVFLSGNEKPVNGDGGRKRPLYGQRARGWRL